MAQLVAHLHGMERVRGSNPLSSTDKASGVIRKLFSYSMLHENDETPTFPPLLGSSQRHPRMPVMSDLHPESDPNPVSDTAAETISVHPSLNGPNPPMGDMMSSWSVSR